MKTVPLHFRRSTAFTLIELLTVIAIIAVLMGLLFPAIGGVKEMARKTQAKNDAIGIVNGVKAYYSEYGKYPVASTGGGDYGNKEVDKTITDALTGVTEGASLNPRKIPFMEMKPAKGTGDQPKKEGLDSTTGKFLDPWGNAYFISIDGNYDNKIASPVSADGDLNTGVLVWSKGKDGDLATGTAKSDDVYSWK